MFTEYECKRILSKIGLKLGASPNLISNRLLSKDDKIDMMYGKVPLDALELHVKVWIANKMPNYSLGKREIYRPHRYWDY